MYVHIPVNTLYAHKYVLNTKKAEVHTYTRKKACEDRGRDQSHAKSEGTRSHQKLDRGIGPDLPFRNTKRNQSYQHLCFRRLDVRPMHVHHFKSPA